MAGGFLWKDSSRLPAVVLALAAVVDNRFPVRLGFLLNLFLIRTPGGSDEEPCSSQADSISWQRDDVVVRSFRSDLAAKDPNYGKGMNTFDAPPAPRPGTPAAGMAPQPNASQK